MERTSRMLRARGLGADEPHAKDAPRSLHGARSWSGHVASARQGAPDRDRRFRSRLGHIARGRSSLRVLVPRRGQAIFSGTSATLLLAMRLGKSSGLFGGLAFASCSADEAAASLRRSAPARCSAVAERKWADVGLISSPAASRGQPLSSTDDLLFLMCACGLTVNRAI